MISTAIIPLGFARRERPRIGDGGEMRLRSIDRLRHPRRLAGRE
jgi:hypothetical protein